MPPRLLSSAHQRAVTIAADVHMRGGRDEIVTPPAVGLPLEEGCDVTQPAHRMQLCVVEKNNAAAGR
jgi:hypothetical protein